MKPKIDAQRLRGTLADCIRFPSPQPDMEAVRQFILQVVKPRLDQLPWDSVSIDGMGNLIARLAGQDHQSPLLFCTYAATVPAGSMPDPFQPRFLDGQRLDQPGEQFMWGRGSSEQMAALAAGIEAVTVYCQEGAPRRRDLIFATTVAGEMGCHDAVEYMMSAAQLAYGPTLIAMGTNNAVYVGNMGRIDVHVEIRGQTCHSSNPSRGRNSIEGARLFLNALKQVPLPHPDPDLGQPTLTPTFIASSPTISHTVPDLCRLTLDRRLIPGEEMEKALSDIEACRSQVSGFEVIIRGGRFNYPSKTPKDAPLVQAASAALSAEGIDPVFRYARWALDAGFFRRQNVDAIMLGPGDEALAHTEEEMVSIRDLEVAARVYVRMMRAMDGR